MPLSSDTVFVIVEDDLMPPVTSTALIDADGDAIDRSAETVKLAVKSATGGGPGTDLTASWDGTKPLLNWTASNKRSLGVHYFRWLTDAAGTERWSFPTENPHTLIVVAKTGA